MILEKGSEVGGFVRKRREHVRGKAGAIGFLGDPLLQIFGEVLERRNGEPFHRVVVELRIGASLGICIGHRHQFTRIGNNSRVRFSPRPVDDAAGFDRRLADGVGVRHGE